MRLTDLDPRWLEKDGRKVGFVFQSPTLGKQMWMAVYCPYPGYHELWRAINAAFPEGSKDEGSPYCRSVQTMNRHQEWQIAGGIENASFETMTLTPSLDGSPAGNWHGFITNGHIVGGI
jgi:hypothetical protein